MEIRQIQYFETTCQCQSFSKAAAQLHVTQQAVSKVIQNLEQELGAKLFVRGSKGIQLTEDGEYFRQEAVSILQKEQDIVAHFAALRTKNRNSLKIGVSHGLSYYFNERTLSGFREKKPGLRLEILDFYNHQVEDLVKEKKLDVGFTIAPLKYQELQNSFLFSEPLYCIVNETHPLAMHVSLTMEDILEHKIVMADENFNSYYSFQQRCKEKNIAPEVIKTSNLLFIYDHVLNSGSVGFTLKSYKDIIQYKGIRYIPFADKDSSWKIYLVYNKVSNASLVAQFVSHMKKTAARQG